MQYSIFMGISVFVLIIFAADLPCRSAVADILPKPPKKITEISKKDIAKASRIQKFVKDKKWLRVKKLIGKVKNSTLRQALSWQRLTSQNSGSTFEEIVNFIEARSNWPLQHNLRQRAEEAMTAEIDPERVIAWFKDHPPVTSDGGISLGAALLKLSEKPKAIDRFRRTWVNNNFGPGQERQFYKRYRRFLTRQDHIDRLERLLWEGRYYPVRRMLLKVNKDYRALAFARITLRRYRGSVDRAISKVPIELINNPGLIFERLRWRRRKGRHLDAQKILDGLPEKLRYPELWWAERATLARSALHKGHVSEAYRLAKNHNMKSGPDFVEAEWLAGWIALRFLKESKASLGHFKAQFEASNYPISRARGAYWSGRASESLENSELAKMWYKKASAYSLTYYGQLAKAKITTNAPIKLPHKHIIVEEENNIFEANELVRTVRVLAQAKIFDLLRPFIKTLNEKHSSTSWRTQVAVLSRESGRQDLAIYTAKQAYRTGIVLAEEGYPILQTQKKTKMELALLHALIRQESAFNNKAVSHAGARGLMQIMPATAKLVAKKSKLPYVLQSLTTDKAYNLRLGQAYLTGLLDQFNGSYLLSLVAYNAGPSRAIKWIKRNGDPRDRNIDAIDWIEMIPFMETRNYVQRVIENLHVYRARLNQTKIAFDPEGDLGR
ncbi:MAG: lytic transglycosylase domain-containing protein [Rhodospirillales bacterium]